MIPQENMRASQLRKARACCRGTAGVEIADALRFKNRLAIALNLQHVTYHSGLDDPGGSKLCWGRIPGHRHDKQWGRVSR